MYNHNSASNWTDERVGILKQLWNEGLSASQIAEQLGGMSRNAVVGKLHRLKITNADRQNLTPTQMRTKSSTVKAKANGAHTETKKLPSARAIRALPNVQNGNTVSAAVTDQLDKPVPATLERLLLLPSRKLVLIELSERTCKWPNGDPLTEDFSFCGNISESGPYCAYHARIAFVPPSIRKGARWR